LNNDLQKLEQYTGLAINKMKSKCFFSKGCRNKDELAEILGVPIGYLPIRYLGLPLSCNYPKARHFLPIINKVRRRIEGWQLNYLSTAGRIELVKSVLQQYEKLLGILF